ncbi:MAG: FAD-dependent monooxygenase [Chloroflexota bacterium]
METTKETTEKNLSQTASGDAYAHAIVIGSGMAGLMAAQVLVDNFTRVTIIERDLITQNPNQRRGVPQANHAHTLLPRGQRILSKLFPNLLPELESCGALMLDASRDVVFFENGRWHSPKQRMQRVAASRPLLETTLYKRVANHPQVTILSGYNVRGLLINEAANCVCGVELRPRRGATTHLTELDATLVVDTSGRNSHTPKWLKTAGYETPVEERVDASVGYATCVFEQPENFSDSWQSLYIRPELENGTRGGIVVPMENGRWCVTLLGVAGDHPPTDEAGFLQFARSLPTSRLYDAIKEAKPVGKPFGFRRTENRRRRYDALPAFLEGFLVMGDAAVAMNPIYAQGMTAAAITAQQLENCLKKQRSSSKTSLKGLAQRFQVALHNSLDKLWTVNTSKDSLWQHALAH